MRLRPILHLAIIAGATLIFLNSPVVQASGILGGANCNGPGSTTANSAVCTDTSNSNASPLYGTGSLPLNIANIIAFVAGIAAIIVILVSSIRYITSGGDSSKAGQAKSTLTTAIIGLVIIVAADVFINLLVNKLL